MTAVSLAEARSRLRADHGLLGAAIEDVADDELAAPYRTARGPLGDFCDSLHDLVAHVLMWDEINLAVLGEAGAGRPPHWSLDPRWETGDAGRALNRGGVAAGRLLPAPLLRHRFAAVGSALLARFDAYTERDWAAPAGGRGSLSELVAHVWTVPGHPAFRHAALHLDQHSAGMPR